MKMGQFTHLFHFFYTQTGKNALNEWSIFKILLNFVR